MAPTERVRLNHPPDFIINGKPKWTELTMIEYQSETEETYVVDRLNPSRNMIGTIESNYREKAESTQMTMVNMMSDLKCELVVTLGDVRLSQDQEADLLSQHQQWELYKKKYNWKPEKVKVAREKIRAKEKFKKEKVKRVKKSRPKVVKSPEAGKENAVESWRAIFQNVNRSTGTGELKKERKKVAKKINSSVSNTTKTSSLMNWVISEKN